MGFEDVQRRFTAHMRDPDGAPAPEAVEDRRLKIYRGLLFRNVEGFLSNYFPVLKRILGDAAWQALAREYFARHRAATPYFPKMAREFVHYLDGRPLAPGEPPFMRELAYYEWLEAEVLIDVQMLPESGLDPDGDLLAGVPVANPVMRVEAFTWPVHRLSPDYRPKSPPAEPTFLAVYRNSDDRVRFMHLNPVSARLLSLVLERRGRTGTDCLRQIAGELEHPDPGVVVEGGRAAFAQMRTAEVVIGVEAA